MDRPTIFLSSTVHDFADLRSALKDYLELRGCRVFASEFTDFERPLDRHSYDACLATIEKADLFVLFIGRRVGGWFDEASKTSITRAEYRHAYKLAQEGRIRLFCFVRSDVWDHRQSVSDLKRALVADAALSEGQRQKLMNHPSAAMENAEAIISFINEVTKNVETANAAKGLGEAPIANWLCPFATFSQVRQALDPLIVSGFRVSEAAGRKALETLLWRLLQDVVPLIGGTPLNPRNSVLNLRTKLDLRGDQLRATIRMDKKTWTSFASLTAISMGANADPTPLLPVLSTDLLLRYDPSTGTFEHTEEHELLSYVIVQARGLGSDRPRITDLARYGKPVDPSGTRVVPTELVLAWLERLLRWVDLMGAATVLARSLGGGPVSKPPTIPQSPLVDQEALLKKEAISLDQVRQFVRNSDKQ